VEKGSHSNMIFQNGNILDLGSGSYSSGDIVVEDGLIAEVGHHLEKGNKEELVDLQDRYVLPGFIDCHVHVTAATANLASLRSWSPRYEAFKTAALMSDMLDRGFTTVRDVGGADYGLSEAQAEGLIRGPRLFFGGRSLSQTGGHGDRRGRGEHVVDGHVCCPGTSRVADGVEGVRLAAREELRTGAHHLKVMASGGIASPTDRVDSTQYSVEELQAAVAEAEGFNRYVAAHAYTARSVNRALRAGVRTIEHGNLIDEESVRLFQDTGAFLVMTLVTYWALNREGREYGLSESSWSKVADVLDGGMRALELAVAGGIPIGFGTDLLGGMQRHQNEEFAIRADVQAPLDVLRSATVVAAEIVQCPGKLGVIAPGAFADMVVLDDDPLEDIRVLTKPEEFRYVIQGGRIVRSN